MIENTLPTSSIMNVSTHNSQCVSVSHIRIFDQAIPIHPPLKTHLIWANLCISALESACVYVYFTHFNMKSKLGLRSRSPGYSCCVASMASPTRPAKTSFCIPAHIHRRKTHIYTHLPHMAGGLSSWANSKPQSMSWAMPSIILWHISKEWAIINKQALLCTAYKNNSISARLKSPKCDTAYQSIRLFNITIGLPSTSLHLKDKQNKVLPEKMCLKIKSHGVCAIWLWFSCSLLQI